MTGLRGRTAVITGASRGIGPHIARALVAERMDVVLTARASPELDAHASALGARGVRAHAIPADLRIPAERERLVVEATAALGRLDVLVNNAGVDNPGSFEALDARTLAETIEINLIAPMHLTALVLPQMRARRSGHIVNVASLAGKKALPYEAVYGGTKAGLIEWTSALRIELRGTGVSLSAVCPGYVRDEGMFARWRVTPLRLFGSTTPSAVARAVVRALRENRPEIFVTSALVRPWLALYALAPALAGRLVDLLGLTAFQRRKVGAPD